MLARRRRYSSGVGTRSTIAIVLPPLTSAV
jgi:hypothetical protein